jgi:hypothetical protein
MSENRDLSSGSEEMTPAEAMSALFAQLIIQQTNMAMMLLGKLAHPESGKIYKDVEAARLFIDQLEMLETKTKGNLTKEESALLKQSLMNLRLAFVEAVDSAAPHRESVPKESSGPTNAAGSTPGVGATSDSTPPAAEDEHRKKFSKKY